MAAVRSWYLRVAARAQSRNAAVDASSSRPEAAHAGAAGCATGAALPAINSIAKKPGSTRARPGTRVIDRHRPMLTVRMRAAMSPGARASALVDSGSTAGDAAELHGREAVLR